MSDLKITPGPWRIERTKDFNASYRVMDEQEVTVALCYQQPHDTWKANAQAIAALPDLLDACEAAQLAFRELAEAAGDVPEWNEGGIAYEASQLLKRAVEKAEGRQ